MSRRVFLQSLTALVGSFILPAIAPAKSSLSASRTLQVSPLVGFQYHLGETLWSQLTVRPEHVEGLLQPVRKANNRHDDRAVRVEWHGHKIGYIPRLDNTAMSQLLDRGERLEAVIVGLENSSNPWKRIKMEVRWYT